MHALARLLILAVLVPATPAAAQSLPNEIVGHKIRVPGDKVEGTTEKLSEVEREIVNALPPQQQAERLLQYAISHHVGATDEIKARVKEWRGAITTSAAMETLLDVARNGANLRVRAAAIEIELAAANLAKSAGTGGHPARADCPEPEGRAVGNLHARVTRQPRRRDRSHPQRAPRARACRRLSGSLPGVRRHRQSRHRRFGRRSRRGVPSRSVDQPCRSTAAVVAWRTAGC